MKPIYLKIILFDPLTDEEYPVTDGIEAEVVKIDSDNPLVGYDPIKLKLIENKEYFFLDAPKYKPGRNHFFRIGFKKVNFSKKIKKLLSFEEVEPNLKPVYVPSRLPYWDTGWDDNYETNEFFNGNDIIHNSENEPIILKIPLRRIYNIGHRGAPYHFPENTIESFRKALDLGANGLEFDLCLCKDNKIAVFHDSKPVKFPGQIDRTLFEDLPFELCSPEFTDNGRFALIREFIDGKYKKPLRLKVNSVNEYDIANIPFNRLNRIYKYHHVNGREYSIPDLDEFLKFISEEKERINLVFFDVKSPDWDKVNDVRKFLSYGKLIGESIKKYKNLPEKLVVSNPDISVLQYLKRGIESAGEERCVFSFDAEGSIGALFGKKSDPLHVARVMGNSVISIGSLFRPGSVNEISDSARDRDYNNKSEINTVIHWTLNNTSQMYLSLLAGVNGILTDKPDLLKDVLKRLKINLG